MGYASQYAAKNVRRLATRTLRMRSRCGLFARLGCAPSFGLLTRRAQTRDYMIAWLRNLLATKVGPRLELPAAEIIVHLIVTLASVGIIKAVIALVKS